jgi:hypothetical protein
MTSALLKLAADREGDGVEVAVGDAVVDPGELRVGLTAGLSLGPLEHAASRTMHATNAAAARRFSTPPLCPAARDAARRPHAHRRQMIAPLLRGAAAGAAGTAALNVSPIADGGLALVTDQ